MKVGIVVGVLVILAIGAGVVYWSLKTPEEFNNGIPDFVEKSDGENRNKVEIQDTQTIDSNLVIGSDSNNSPDSYQEYSKATLDQDAGKKIRILFFYADWCPECRPLDTEIKANLDKIPEDISIIKINYQDNYTDQDEKALAQKYGVTYQHTFVRIDSADNEVEKWNGDNFEKLLTHIKEISAINPKQLDKPF